jgi:hypothetical protein
MLPAGPGGEFTGSLNPVPQDQGGPVRFCAALAVGQVPSGDAVITGGRIAEGADTEPVVLHHRQH